MHCGLPAKDQGVIKKLPGFLTFKLLLYSHLHVVIHSSYQKRFYMFRMNLQCVIHGNRAHLRRVSGSTLKKWPQRMYFSTPIVVVTPPFCYLVSFFWQGSNAGKVDGLCSTFNGSITAKNVSELSASGWVRERLHKILVLAWQCVIYLFCACCLLAVKESMKMILTVQSTVTRLHTGNISTSRHNEPP